MNAMRKSLTILGSAAALALGGIAIAQTSSNDNSGTQDSAKMSQGAGGASNYGNSASPQSSGSNTAAAGAGPDTSSSTSSNTSNSSNTSSTSTQDSGLAPQADRN